MHVALSACESLSRAGGVVERRGNCCFTAGCGRERRWQRNWICVAMVRVWGARRGGDRGGES